MTTTIEPSCTTLPLEIYPSMHPLALDLVRGEPRAIQFFHPSSPGEIPPDRRELGAALRRTNASWGNAVEEEISAWERAEADAVIAGQQVGFGGGPLYTLVKLASLVHLRRAARREKRRVVAFFWMATEDHDFDEVSRLTLQESSETHEYRTRTHPPERFPVGPLDVPEDLRTAIEQATRFPAEGWLEPGLSFRDSFARLIASVTRGEVILVDSLLPELRVMGRELFSKAASEFESIQAAIHQRSSELQEAGYPAQVKPSDAGDYTLFYEIDRSGLRRPLDSGARLAELSRVAPETVSTAALMRPLLQDFVFTPRVFVGGPSEVAYYAQLGRVYELVGLASPKVMLRAHTLVAPERLIRKMERHGIAPEEWLDTPDAILSRRERTREAQLSERIGSLERHFEAELDQIRRSILQADPSLTRSFNRTARRINHHLQTLQRRGARAIARSDLERFEAVERFSNVIRPAGVVQDRTIAWLSYWSLWRDRLFDSIIPFAEPGTDRLRIIGIS